MTLNSNDQNDFATLFIHVFHDHNEAEGAYNDILNRNYNKDEINVLMSQETRDRYFGNSVIPDSNLANETEAAGVGSVLGGAIGGIAAAVLAVGSVFTLPGLGIMIAGPIATGLAGAGVGSIVGGLTGALIGSGVSEELAGEYERAINNGSIVIMVNTHSAEDYQYFENRWKI